MRWVLPVKQEDSVRIQLDSKGKTLITGAVGARYSEDSKDRGSSNLNH